MSPYEVALSKLPYARTMIRGLGTRSGDAPVTSCFPLVYSDSTGVLTGGGGAIGGNVDTIPTGSGSDYDPSTVPEVVYAYVFNFGQQEGFAIVSTLDYLPDVLAFSDDSSFNPVKQDDSEESDDSDMSGYIAGLHQNDFVTDMFSRTTDFLLERQSMSGGTGDVGDASDQWRRVDTVIKASITYMTDPKGLCKVRWHGKAPFINYFNLINPKSHNVISPVVVALAQYLSVMKYPEDMGDWQEWTRLPEAEQLPAEYQEDLSWWFGSLVLDLNSNIVDVNIPADFINLKKALRKFGYNVDNAEAYGKCDANVATELSQGYPVFAHCVSSKYKYAWLIDGYAVATHKYILKCTRHNTTKECYERFAYLHFNWGLKGKSRNGYYLWDLKDYGNLSKEELPDVTADEFYTDSVYEKVSVRVCYGARPVK